MKRAGWIFGFWLGLVMLAACASGGAVSESVPDVSGFPMIPERGKGFEEGAVWHEQVMEKILSKLEITDYADIITHSREYEGRTFTVVGQISTISYTPGTFCFREHAPGSFYVDFLYDGKGLMSTSQIFRDIFSVGDYVVVQGVWDSVLEKLDDAVLLGYGPAAQRCYERMLQEWYDTRSELAATAPLVPVADILGDERYLGQVVRTAGKVSAITPNMYYDDIAFQLDSSECAANYLIIYMWGSPEDMEALCTEGKYVVVSGVVVDELGIKLKNCYVECAGEVAERAYLELEQQEYERRRERMEEYRTQCGEYDYEQLMRYPDQYKGERIAVSGTVLRTKYTSSYIISAE